MSPHFCKVGKIKSNKLIAPKGLESKIKNFLNDTTKINYSEDLNAAL